MNLLCAPGVPSWQTEPWNGVNCSASVSHYELAFGWLASNATGAQRCVQPNGIGALNLHGVPIAMRRDEVLDALRHTLLTDMSRRAALV